MIFTVDKILDLIFLCLYTRRRYPFLGKFTELLKNVNISSSLKMFDTEDYNSDLLLKNWYYNCRNSRFYFVLVFLVFLCKFIEENVQ